MLLCRYSFAPKTDDAANRERLADEVQGLVGALTKNGQVWGDDVCGWQDGKHVLMVNIPLPDSLADEHSCEWVETAHKRVVELCAEKPSWAVVDERPGIDLPAWKDGPGLYLYTHLFDKTSPVCAGANGTPLPLYLLPVDQKARQELVAWQGEYKAMDDLQIGCGPLELDAYSQMADPNSELSQQGRRLAKLCEEATTLPTYYYLIRHRGRESGEGGRLCPGCGGAWSKERASDARGLGWFDFQCTRCRLVSHVADTVADTETRARVGEWQYSSRAARLFQCKDKFELVTDEMDDLVCKALGIDGEWPFDDIRYDAYDWSVELSGCQQGFDLSRAQRRALLSFGYRICHLRYKDGSAPARPDDYRQRLESAIAALPEAMTGEVRGDDRGMFAYCRGYDRATEVSELESGEVWVEFWDRDEDYTDRERTFADYTAAMNAVASWLVSGTLS